ncbi:MAG: hypothetical protein WBC93_03705 [Sulfitobacter sp.]
MLRMMYAQDSFLTLGIWGQIGLASLSLLLSGVLIWGVSRLKGCTLLRVGAVCVAFWLFIWLSPQIYYLYYLVLIDGLPWQIVIRPPPGPADIARLISFLGDQTLAAHGQGVLFWAGQLAALWPWRSPKCRNAAN